jgi:hypothetical protein
MARQASVFIAHAPCDCRAGLATRRAQALLAEELHLAHDARRNHGAFTADDLLGEIFGRFIGK